MNVSCPDCRSIFRVDPAKVPFSGVRARCSVCSGVISIPAPTGQVTPAGGGGRTPAPPSESGSQDRPRSAPAGQGGWDPPPFGSASQRPAAAAPGPAQRPAPPPAPQAQRPAPPPPQAQRPGPPPPPQRTAETPAARPRPESIERASVTATATPPSPSSGLPEFTQPAPTPPVASPGASAPTAPPFVPSGSPSRPPATPRPPARTPVASPAAGDGGPRRPLNPFLSKDPNQRAKRLARALVSDIITYHPAKHAEGLRDGTLKQLFREEIKKSFEEYIAQVGQQLAESTTYFQEALNEVLAAGKKIF